MELLNYIVDIKCSVMEAIRKIDANAKGIVYVTELERLVGVITDGDVRRYIMKNGELRKNVSNVMNVTPFFLQVGSDGKANEFMRRMKIRSVPVIDGDNRIVKIYFQDSKVESKLNLDIPVVIMAGGKGTRLYPYTQILPKPLIPIGDRTITEHIMDRFQEFGCNEFCMIVNYKKNFIKSFFEEQERKELVKFVEENEFLGTGGGLKLIEDKYKSTIFMTNCDILIEADYSDILNYHTVNKNLVTMVCAKKNMTIPYGIVEISNEGQAVCLKEKPEYSFITNTGLYVLEPEFIKMIPDNTFIHITDIIQQCIEGGEKVGVYTISEENWLDMGQLEELEKMKQKLSVN